MIPALTLARYSQLAYKPLEVVQAALPDAEITLLDKDDSQAYVIETSTETVIAFRGTQVTSGFSMTDLIRNAKVTPVPWSSGLGSSGRVHRGYKEALDAIADDLAKIVIQTKRPLIYTGHSAGGSIATLARCHSPHPDATVTFGAPKVGNREFVKAYSHIHLLRFTHGRDLAPKHPRPWLGYRHGGGFRKIARNGQITERSWGWWDEVILPFDLVAGTWDHRIGEYVSKMESVEL